MKKKAEKVLVTRRALIQRINRVLAKREEQLRAYRGGRWQSDLGRYYIVDLGRNAIVRGDVDLEDVGRELKVIAGYEAIEKEEP